jgi:hypothetical protein
MPVNNGVEIEMRDDKTLIFTRGDGLAVALSTTFDLGSFVALLDSLEDGEKNAD